MSRDILLPLQFEEAVLLSRGELPERIKARVTAVLLSNKCPWCVGSGYMEGEHDVCPECGGDGERD